MERYQAKPTFPTTAVVLDKNPSLFQRLMKQGAVLAIHGLRHVDYTMMDRTQNASHFQEAMALFNKAGYPCEGFRFPYLRRDKHRIEWLAEAGFRWDSSEVILWENLSSRKCSRSRWKNFQTILETYQPMDSGSASLPRFIGEMVEIPVAMPDDDILIERLGIRKQEVLAAVWSRMLERACQTGECLVLQLHPERYFQFNRALETILRKAQSENVWIASLQEIAEWWIERDSVQFIIRESDSGIKEICLEGSSRATLLVKGTKGYTCDGPGNFTVQGTPWKFSGKEHPIVGIDPGCSQDITAWMRQEGYPYELMNHRQYSTVLLPSDEMKLKRDLSGDYSLPVQGPLMRIWRWPENRKCCLAVTGDIDGVTIWDFIRRYHE